MFVCLVCELPLLGLKRVCACCMCCGVVCFRKCFFVFAYLMSFGCDLLLCVCACCVLLFGVLCCCLFCLIVVL